MPVLSSAALPAPLPSSMQFPLLLPSCPCFSDGSRSQLNICRLPNIGKKRAASIVAARVEGGPFSGPADLTRIGLSDKQADKLCTAYAAAVAEGRLALAAAKARKSL